MQMLIALKIFQFYAFKGMNGTYKIFKRYSYNKPFSNCID